MFYTKKLVIYSQTTFATSTILYKVCIFFVNQHGPGTPLLPSVSQITKKNMLPHLPK